jgi:hypothetical protein
LARAAVTHDSQRYVGSFEGEEGKDVFLAADAKTVAVQACA